MFSLRKMFSSARPFPCPDHTDPRPCRRKPVTHRQQRRRRKPRLTDLFCTARFIETMNSSGYTYLLLDATQGKIWVAIPETQVKTGQTVACTPGMTMYNFTSKTLNRTFEAIVFSPGLDKGTASGTGSNHGRSQTARRRGLWRGPAGRRQRSQRRPKEPVAR